MKIQRSGQISDELAESLRKTAGLSKSAYLEEVKGPLGQLIQTVNKVLGDKPMNPHAPGMMTWGQIMTDYWNGFAEGASDKNPERGKMKIEEIFRSLPVYLQQAVQLYPQAAQALQQASAFLEQAKAAWARQHQQS